VSKSVLYCCPIPHKYAAINAKRTERFMEEYYTQQCSHRASAKRAAYEYILGIDFQGDDLWVATAKGLSYGIRQRGLTETAQVE
jgi:hypothetical protein